MENQKNNTKRNILLVFGAILAILLGYLRDSVFKTINALLRAWDLNQDYFLPKYLSFLENFEYETLANLKWVLTLFFSFLYLLLSVFVIKLLFSSKKHLEITIFTYLGIIALSGIFILTGMVWNPASEKMYEFARYLMGMAQSPVILMILIPTFKLLEKENNKTSKQ